MKIVTMDWTEIYNKLETKEKDITHAYNANPINEEYKTNNGSTKRIYHLDDLIPNCLEVFWDKLYQVLASVEPIKIDDQYSPLETMRNIPEVIKTPYGDISRNNFKAIVNILNKVPRSYTLPGAASEHPQWSQLVPLWLAAFKHYKNINYNSWIRDNYIWNMVGEDLYNDIKDIPDDFVFDISKVADLRKAALTTKVGTSKITSPVRKSFFMTPDWKIKLNNKVAAMYLQIWLANVQLRHPDMILDPVDWDRMPEAYDVVLENTNTYVSAKKKPRRYNNEEMPF